MDNLAVHSTLTNAHTYKHTTQAHVCISCRKMGHIDKTHMHHQKMGCSWINKRITEVEGFQQNKGQSSNTDQDTTTLYLSPKFFPPCLVLHFLAINGSNSQHRCPTKDGDTHYLSMKFFPPCLVLPLLSTDGSTSQLTYKQKMDIFAACSILTNTHTNVQHKCMCTCLTKRWVSLTRYTQLKDGTKLQKRLKDTTTLYPSLKFFLPYLVLG